MLEQVIDKVSYNNPQLFRELKGRLNPLNLAIATAVSVVGQIFIYLIFLNKLPKVGSYSRYCVGNPPEDLYPEEATYHGLNNFCIHDLLGNVKIIKELWWLDIFITMTVVGIFILLVIGTYLLIADLSKEESQGTLNFIRLSPQTAQNILLGKVLGVPILLYWVGLCAIPFHLFAGFNAHIPLSLILLFYVVLAFSCAFFYSGAILVSLTASKVNGFQAFLGAGVLLVYLFFTFISIFNVDMVTNTPIDWLIMFNPMMNLSYLVKSTFLPPDTVNYFRWENLQNLLWYGQSFWSNFETAIGLILINYAVFTYWLWQGVKRRFNKTNATVWNKKQSYLLTSCFVVFNLGFTLQNLDFDRLYSSFGLFSLLNFFLFLVLIAAITPQRQPIQDWVNYRYQHGKPKLLIDLVFGENSPSILAIGINLAIVGFFSLPAIMFFDLGDQVIAALTGILLTFNLIIIFSVITQMILILKTPKRGILAIAAVGTLTIVPLLSCAIMGLDYINHAWLFLFSPLAMLGAQEALTSTIIWSILTQWLVIVLANIRLNKQISGSVVKALPN